VALIDSAKAAINASLGSGFTTAAQRVLDILDVLEKSRARHAVVFDKEDKVEFHEHGSTGANIIRELLEYCDKKMSLLLLGQELTTTAPGHSSYALGDVHRQKEETVIMYNRQRAVEVLERDLIFDILFRNRVNLYRLGCMVPEPGDIQMEIKVKKEQMKNRAMEKYMSSSRSNVGKMA
jgi:phage gp29-like protein